uniref:GDP-fucose transporter n=2 Tax=Schistocephalus solidus TaxID=70667 RepID=A0A0X3PTM1_SCHSO
MLITLLECIVTSCVCAFRLRASRFSLWECVRKGLRTAMSEHSLSLKLPVFFALMITFNNMCLYYLDLPVYFVARSFSPLFNVILFYRMLKDRRLLLILPGIALIIVGYIITMVEENTINLLIAEGVILGVLSSLFVEFYTLETNKLPDKTPEVYLKQVYVNNVCGVILLLVGAFATSELTELQFLPIAPTLDTLVFWSLLVLGCICAAIVGGVVLEEINSYPSFHRQMLGLVRSVLQTIAAVFIFFVYTTKLWWVGVLLVAIGTALYIVGQRKHEETAAYSSTKAPVSQLPLLVSD